MDARAETGEQTRRAGGAQRETATSHPPRKNSHPRKNCCTKKKREGVRGRRCIAAHTRLNVTRQGCRRKEESGRGEATDKMAQRIAQQRRGGRGRGGGRSASPAKFAKLQNPADDRSKCDIAKHAINGLPGANVHVPHSMGPLLWTAGGLSEISKLLRMERDDGREQ